MTGYQGDKMTKLKYEVKTNIQENAIVLELDDNSKLEMYNFNRSLEYNTILAYGYKTTDPIFYFNSIHAINKNEGRGRFLLEISNYILDQHNFWVLNEVRPVDFSRENLDSLVDYYKKFNYRLLQKGIDSALMLRIPDPTKKDFPHNCLAQA